MHDCVAAHGCRPAEYLDRLGLLTERHGARARRLARRRRARARRRARRDDRHQPGVEHEARGRPRVPVPGGPRRGRPDRARHRRRRRRTTRSTCSPSSRCSRCCRSTPRSTPRCCPPPRRGRSRPAPPRPRLGGTPLAVGAPADFVLVDAAAPEMRAGAARRRARVLRRPAPRCRRVVVAGRGPDARPSGRRRGRDPRPGRLRRPGGCAPDDPHRTPRRIPHDERTADDRHRHAARPVRRVPRRSAAGSTRARARRDPRAAARAIAPATPEWRVHDVLAHLVGVPADILAGRLDGVASRRVDRGAGRTRGATCPRARCSRSGRRPARRWSR